MSGIYIKGMEMPKDGKVTGIIIYPDGKVRYSFDWLGISIATAVPIPPHGRLGDLDELLKLIKEEGRNQAKFYADRYHPVVLAYGDCYGKVKEAPTIIPASEEDK